MSIVLDANELSDQKNKYENTIDSVVEGIGALRIATEKIVNEVTFEGKTAESIKSFFTEVHYAAIALFEYSMELSCDSINEFINKSIDVDDSENAHIEEDYLENCLKEDLVFFRNSFDEKDNEIMGQIQKAELCMDIAIERPKGEDTISACVDAIRYIEQTIDKLYDLDEYKVHETLETVIGQFSQVISYMSDCLIDGAGVTYTVGAITKQDWYDNVSKTIEDYNEKQVRALTEKLEEDYEAGIVDEKTYKSLLSGLLTGGIAFIRESLITKLSDEVSEKLAESAINWLMTNTTHFMNRGLIGALASGGDVLITEVPSMLSTAIRCGARYGIPIIGGFIDFGIQVASGENVVDAAAKATAHVGIGIGAAKVGAAIGTAIGGPIGTVVGGATGFILGVAGSMIFDTIWDNKEEIADTIVTGVKSVTDTVGSAVNTVGDAVSGFFSGVASVFS